MKKVLIGVGIGCGVLLVIVIGLVVVGGLWAKSKVEGYAEAATEVGEKMDAQNKELNELDREHSFTVPPEGTPVKLEQDRVQQYLAVRAALAPVVKQYEDREKALKARTKNGQGSFSDLTEAAGMIAGFTTELRGAFIAELKKQRMSPKEFHATTQAIYSSAIGSSLADMARANKEALAETVSSYEEQLKDSNLSKEERADLEEQLADAQSQLDEADKTLESAPAAAAINEANAEVLKAFKGEIEKQANPVLDALLMSDDEDATSER